MTYTDQTEENQTPAGMFTAAVAVAMMATTVALQFAMLTIASAWPA